MQMVKKSAAAVFLLWFMVILFMPKEEFYFRLEQELAKQDIVLNEESRSEGIFSLSLENVTVYAKGIHLATIEALDFCTLLFYSSVDIEDLIIDESLKGVLPTQIENVRLSQGIWAPLRLSVNAEGAFGEGTGAIDISKHTLRMNFNDAKGLEMLGAKLQQGEKGWVYETSF